jgi:hypothetical protein
MRHIEELETRVVPGLRGRRGDEGLDRGVEGFPGADSEEVDVFGVPRVRPSHQQRLASLEDPAIGLGEEDLRDEPPLSELSHQFVHRDAGAWCGLHGAALRVS